jgi:hypothetical protein
MSSPTQSTSDNSFPDVMFAAALVVACLLALAISVHVFRGRRFHRGPATVGIEQQVIAPVRLAFVR